MNSCVSCSINIKIKEKRLERKMSKKFLLPTFFVYYVMNSSSFNHNVLEPNSRIYRTLILPHDLITFLILLIRDPDRMGRKKNGTLFLVYMNKKSHLHNKKNLETQFILLSLLS